MRILFLGAGDATVFAAESLIEEGHDIVIIEPDEARIDEVSGMLDCGFLHGDGGRPGILREAGVEDADVVLCVSDDDRANILAGLVALQLGVKRVVISVEDDDLGSVCESLELERVIVPARMISRHLHDLARGVDSIELSTVLKHDARLFGFAVDGRTAGPIEDLHLPEDTGVLWFYRGQTFEMAAPDTVLREGDEVVLLTHSDRLRELAERWKPQEPGES